MYDMFTILCIINDNKEVFQGWHFSRMALEAKDFPEFKI